MKKNRFFISYFLFFTLLILLSSCVSQAAAEKRLLPIRSVTEIRLNDIAKHVEDDPVQALHFIEVFNIIYGSEAPDNDVSETVEQLSVYRENAVANLKKKQLAAIEEKRWPDAASMARSLSALGIPVESTGEEPEIALEYAKDQTGKNNLSASPISEYSF